MMTELEELRWKLRAHLTLPQYRLTPSELLAVQRRLASARRLTFFLALLL